METGRSWLDLSSLERVLIQDYWPGLPNTPFKVIQKANAAFESNHLLNSHLIQRKRHFFRCRKYEKENLSS